jgi:excisionase family DNA binding protein
MCRQGVPLLLSIDAASALLGIPRRSLYSMMNAGKLPPSFKLQGRRVFRRDDLTRWVEMGMPSLQKFEVLSR